jgi:hypothetical protein
MIELKSMIKFDVSHIIHYFKDIKSESNWLIGSQMNWRKKINIKINIANIAFYFIHKS